MMTNNIMIVGVGGQGSLLASKLMGRLLIDEGYDVKVSEVHGMSQRGGSVVTYVRFGEKVYSPIITAGEADLIISFEKLEAARYAPFLKKGGRIVVNTQQIDPMPVIIGAATYPENVLDELTAKGVRVEAMDALALAEKYSTERDSKQLEAAKFGICKRIYDSGNRVKGKAEIFSYWEKKFDDFKL